MSQMIPMDECGWCGQEFPTDDMQIIALKPVCAGCVEDNHRKCRELIFNNRDTVFTDEDGNTLEEAQPARYAELREYYDGPKLGGGI